MGVFLMSRLVTHSQIAPTIYITVAIFWLTRHSAHGSCDNDRYITVDQPIQGNVGLVSLPEIVTPLLRITYQTRYKSKENS
jgi:hypothetical protein